MADYTRHPARPGQSPTTTSAALPTASPSAAATASQQSQPSQHKRVYQACIPCRRRKVRCDLGSVDNPHDPPCVRCRRESKDCYFSATRRKRKGDEELDPDGYSIDEYTVRNGRKRVFSRSTAGGSLSPTSSIDRRLYSEVPLVPGGVASGSSQHVRREPLRRPEGGGGSRSVASTTHSDRRSSFGPTIGDDSNAQLENFEAQTVMRQGVFGPHDALDLLYKAATDGRVDHKQEEPVAPAIIPPVPPQPIINHPTPAPSRRDTRDSRSMDARSTKIEPTIDPALTNRNMADDPGYMEAIKAWSRFRFVRAGWFSAQEAIEYIDYYYKYLSPLTPISPPTFHNPGSHLTLLLEEPVLTVTLLTIASRFRKLEGTGGQCRANAIHEQLWTYLRGMIERCLWGQEAFGGGLFPPGSIVTDEAQTSSTAPWRGLRKGSLRTLGTIESLMILTEWHPRALHFPAPEAIDELMLPSYGRESNFMSDDEGVSRPPGGGVGGKRIESWLEPAWRSDRMCWMLLSTATGLAYELGVFDDIDELLRDETITRPEYEEESYRQRAYRIKRLLLIYSTQLAGRLGWTNMVPESLRKSDPAVSRRRPTSVEGGATPGTNTSVLSNAFNYIPDLELDDQIIHCWAGITNAMHIGNEKLFRSRKYTAEIIKSGRYLDLLKEFQPLFRDWHKEFERFRLPPYTRYILTIEYEYVRIYVSSLSLQAVVERCTSNAGNTAAAAGAAAGAGSTGNAPAQLSPQTQNYYGNLPLGVVGGFTAVDQEHIKEVVDGCRNLLRTVVDGLLPGGYLKHAPVRTYFRIISGAMFLLKTFALGAPRADVKVSIDLMDDTVEALKNCVVDDVHLGIRFADLLESLTSRLRNRFIQAPTAGQVASADPRTPNPGGVMDGGLATNGLGGPPDSSWAAITSKLREGLHAHDSPNISATPFDLTTGTFPYPSGAASALNPSTPAPATLDGAANNGVGGGATANGSLAPGVGAGAASLSAANAGAGAAGAGGGNAFDDWNNPDNEMWYLPPGPAFFQNMDNSMVEMTAEGVSVGGMDLLEYMVMDSAPQYGTGPFGA